MVHHWGGGDPFNVRLRSVPSLIVILAQQFWKISRVSDMTYGLLSSYFAEKIHSIVLHKFDNKIFSNL